MISLKRSIKDHESADAELVRRKALECYLGALEVIRTNAPELSEEEVKDHRARLGGLAREITGAVSVADLEASQAALEKEVSEYYGKVSGALKASQQEVKEIIALLREATSTMVTRNAHHDQQFRSFATNLERTSQCDDLRKIRLQLTLQVGQLRTNLDSMREERAQALEPLQTELRSFEARLEEAERLACTDPLTNLFNRREGEKRAKQRQERGVVFCFLVIDLNRFKFINDRYGHLAGDQVLQQVARRLEQQVRANDTVCRWGGDEFLIIMECKLPDGLQRANQIGRTLSGRYSLNLNKRLEVEVGMSIGVAQCEPGETLEAAFARADAMLYQIKDASRPR